MSLKLLSPLSKQHTLQILRSLHQQLNKDDLKLYEIPDISVQISKPVFEENVTKRPRTPSRP